MYCPNCGSGNPAGTKFCTRCGTNLAIVTDALTGKLSGAVVDDEQRRLLKDYYKGRRSFILGSTLIISGAFLMALLASVGLPGVAAFFIVFWLFCWGTIVLGKGLSGWLSASGEMKALGYNLPQNNMPRAPGQNFIPPPPAQFTPPSGEYNTGPVDMPASVTEQTTRHLDERDYRTPVERKSKQTS